MKVSRLLTIAILAASCNGGATDESHDTFLAQAPAGQAQEQPRQAQTAKPTPAPAPEQKQPATAIPTTGTAVNSRAAILQDFKARIDAYMKLRKEAVKDAPALKETKDPAKIKAAQDGMATAIRAARADAKHGDVFTPQIAAEFRRLLYPELKGDDGRDAKEIIKDDAPTNVPFKVNAKYPDGAPVPTVPANLLINLPTLPEPLQYRIIDKHLVLVDEDADVIVDYSLNVIR